MKNAFLRTLIIIIVIIIIIIIIIILINNDFLKHKGWFSLATES